MRKIRIYQPGHFHAGQTAELSPQAAQHVAQVLRMTAGDPLILFNGEGLELEAHITLVKKKQVLVEIETINHVNRESPLRIHLAQGLSKGDRMDWAIQKSVELGVAEITPLISAHCAVRLDKERIEKKLQHWQGIIIAACEQSGRTIVPLLHTPVIFEEFVKAATETVKLIAHPEGNTTWRDYCFESGNVSLMIGPEGGFSEEEVRLANQYQFGSLSLGPRILRTETAAITVLSVLQALNGGL